MEGLMKMCTHCREYFPATNDFFYKQEGGKYGLRGSCKKCLKNEYMENKKNAKNKKNVKNKKNKNINIEKFYTVYVHINKFNNKMYIGVTKQKPEDRWKKGKGYGSTTHFYSDVEKYGWDNFEHEIIASGLTKEEGENFEILLISKLNATNPNIGYNLEYGGSGSKKRKTDKTKNKIKDTFKETELKIGLTQSRKVSCDNRIFNSIKECADYYNVKADTMRAWLTGRNKMPQNFVDLNLYSLKEYKKGKSRNNGASCHKSKKVICDDVIYDTIKLCAEKLNIKYSTLAYWLRNEHAIPQVYKDKGLKLYIDDN